jgi:hypothetical protein
MTVAVANTTINNTWDFWRQRTNQMADVISRLAVTVGSNSAVGDAGIIGSLRANTVYADTLQGGGISNNQTLTIISNLAATANAVVSLNLTVGANATANNLTVTNRIGANTIVVGNTVINGANVTATNFYGVWAGNTVLIGKGGTGLTTVPTNGQVMIGNGAGYTLATIASSNGISVTNGAGTISVKNTGVLSFRAFGNTTPKVGDVVMDSNDVITALGFLPGAAAENYWQRVSSDVNYFQGNVAIGYSDNSPRSNASIMVKATQNVASQNLGLFENGNTLSSSATAYIQVSVSNTSASQGLRFAENNVTVGSIDYSGADVLSFSTANVGRVFIDSAGNLGIGTGSPQPNNGGNGLHIANTNPGTTFDNLAGTKWHIGQNPNSTVWAGGLRKAGAFAIWSDQAQAAILIDANTATANVSVIAGGSNRLNVRADGIVQIGTTGTSGKLSVGGDINAEGSFTNYSDYRLKNEVFPLTNALDRVASLNPVTFRWNKSGLREEGFLAHEVREVIPTAVQGVKDGVVFQTLDKSQITPVVVKAIQELINIVNKQQQELDDLKNR